MAASAKSTELRTNMHKGFYRFASMTYGRILRRNYRLSITVPAALAALKPPYIVLSNHVNTFDPILISVSYPVPIHWVAGDTLFRNPLLGFLMRKLVGAISKSKSRSDYYTIKEMTRIIRKDGGVVGLFPEGQRTWDGKTLPLFEATSKLVKMLKVPVVICILEGGYQTLPRWSNRRRPGKLTLAFKEPLMPESFSGMDAEEIDAMLSEALSHDAAVYDKEHQIRFKSKRPAEYLEHVLYLCPSCGATVSLTSHRDRLTCSACGLTVCLDEYGALSSEGKDFTFTSVAQWNSWQQQEVRRRIREGFWKDDEEIFTGDIALFGEGYRDSKLAYHGKAEVSLDGKGITVHHGGHFHRFLFTEIESVNVAFQRVFEFYFKNRLYRLKFPPPRSSAYKYLSMYELIAQEQDSGLCTVSHSGACTKE